MPVNFITNCSSAIRDKNNIRDKDNIRDKNNINLEVSFTLRTWSVKK
jgi:hypothetical protein